MSYHSRVADLRGYSAVVQPSRGGKALHAELHTNVVFQHLRFQLMSWGRNMVCWIFFRGIFFLFKAATCAVTYLYLSDKEKKIKLEEDEAAAASTMAVSASLMPPIWDKTIPYDGESFHLEYMDLDEFLLENGIPSSPTHLDLNQNPLMPVAKLEEKEPASASTGSPVSSSSTAVYQQSEAASSTGRWNCFGCSAVNRCLFRSKRRCANPLPLAVAG